jgi:transposase InsO family protein
MEDLVCAVRDAFPAWGGRKIRAFLLRQGHTGVPAASTITQILRRSGYLPEVPPSRDRYTHVGSFRAAAPNDMWQIDFKGDFAVLEGGRCYPLGVLDDHSRFNLGLHACGNQQYQTVRDHLVTIFGTYGLPAVLLADNGPPWGTSNPTHRWTPLTVWLLDLEIRVVHSRPKHPQTLGKQERFHLTLDRELLDLYGPWTSLNDLQDHLTLWRHLYNHHRPHESLNHDVPADHYRPSPRPFPDQIEPVTYPDHYPVRTVDAAARISYQNRIFKVGKPFIGRNVGIDPATSDIYYRTRIIRPGVNHVPERA